MLPIESSVNGLLKIFCITSKGPLVQHCKSLTIDSADFVNIIQYSESRLIPYLHTIHHSEFVPIDVAPTREDAVFGQLTPGTQLEGNALKFFNKIGQVFKVRRLLVGHMFINPQSQQWHFFYFDQRDTDHLSNHWKKGPHIHFINYLWPKYTAQTLWEKFATGNPNISRSIHIRYYDADLMPESIHPVKKRVLS